MGVCCIITVPKEVLMETCYIPKLIKKVKTAVTINLEKWASKVGKELKKKQLILSTAESCTGGGLSYWLTHISGSSQWFDRGFVVYNNLAKMDLLNVSAHTLKQFGPVSECVVREMAEGALKNSRAQISIAITGIAGPESDPSNQAIGTIWIAFAQKQESLAYLHHFKGSRQTIRLCTIEAALKHLLQLIV
jgi:nicotinamide-nucleotide amidase